MFLRVTHIIFATSVLLSANAWAAVITWGAVQDTTSSAANDVVDGGAVVLALNGQSQLNSSSLRPGDVTLDGILFESRDYDQFLGAWAIEDQRALSLPEGRSTGDAGYDVFLNHVAFVNTSNATNAANTGLTGTDDDAIYPIQGLTENTVYLIQLWYTDERIGQSLRTAIYGDNVSSLNSAEVPGQGANGFGSFVVGQFTADGSTQDLRIAIDGAPRSHVTGLLVRAVAIPEPTSFSALALASGVFVLGRRRRNGSRSA